jgi:diguanylate cyclase (GGDEF)-like protein
MDLDLRTSTFFIGFINLISATMLVLFARLSPRYRSISQWALANGMGALGCIFLLTAGNKPALPTIAADFLILFSLWLNWFGISLFANRPILGFSYLLALGVITMTLVYLAFVLDPNGLHPIVFSIAAGLVAGASAYVLFRTKPASHRIAHMYGAGLFGLFALAMLVRAIFVIGSSSGQATWNIIGNPSFSFALGAIFMPLWTIGAIMLVVQRHTEELKLWTTIDEATQMLNQEGAKLRIDQEAARSRRSLKSFSILLVSIDNLAGNGGGRDRDRADALVRYVGTALWEHVRFEDMVARWNYSEFMLLLVATSGYQGLSAAERICESIARRSRASGNERLECTVSTGVASFDQAINIDHVVTLAKEALDNAKHRGGNQAAMAPTRTELPPVPAQLRVGIKQPPHARADTAGAL